MKRIGIITTNRADYYLLSPIISKLQSNKTIIAELIVTGGHLLREFGMTIHDISLPIAHIIPIDDSYDLKDSNSINQLLTKIMIGSNELFIKTHFDSVILLGDRFEVSGIAMVLFNLNIPILHLYGGEVTLGSKDNTYRYLISLMSNYHFVSNLKHKNNLLSFGISADNVFEIGYLTNDLVSQVPHKSSIELFKMYDMKTNTDVKFAMISLHPATNEEVTVTQQIELIDLILKKYVNVVFIATSANNDLGGSIINGWYSNQLNKISNLFYVPNLGFENYVNFIRNSIFVIGNSSSLMTDVPILNKPAILLGKRQEGRESLGSVVKCDYNVDDVFKCIDEILENPDIINKFNQPFFSSDKFDLILNSLLNGNLI